MSNGPTYHQLVDLAVLLWWACLVEITTWRFRAGQLHSGLKFGTVCFDKISRLDLPSSDVKIATPFISIWQCTPSSTSCCCHVNWWSSSDGLLQMTYNFFFSEVNSEKLQLHHIHTLHHCRFTLTKSNYVRNLWFWIIWILKGRQTGLSTEDTEQCNVWWCYLHSEDSNVGFGYWMCIYLLNIAMCDDAM